MREHSVKATDVVRTHKQAQDSMFASSLSYMAIAKTPNAELTTDILRQKTLTSYSTDLPAT